MEDREFKGNVKVTVTEGEIRVWVCDEKTGQNIFRFKALGKVFRDPAGKDYTIVGRMREEEEEEE